MEEIVVKLINAISNSISSEFGSEYGIYTESIEETPKAQCFVILCAKLASNLFQGKKYLRENQFCIQYIPLSSKKNEECLVVAERLLDSLEYIIFEDDQIRGNKMNWEMINGVLNFFVNYDMFIYKLAEKITMGELEKKEIAVKG